MVVYPISVADFMGVIFMSGLLDALVLRAVVGDVPEGARARDVAAVGDVVVVDVAVVDVVVDSKILCATIFL